MKNLSPFLMVLIVLASLATLMACEETKKGNLEMINSVQIRTEDWNLLAQRRIAFGHQSVGNNILSGVQALAQQAGVSLPVNAAQIAGAGVGITHFKIGQNEEPYSKIKGFEKILETGEIPRADIAMMKLCYIDFNSRTDAIKLARDYSESLDRLSQKFPNTFFLAVTSPLTTVQSGPKAWIKTLLGRTPSGYLENYKRKEFNDYLRSRYNESGHLFDLAKYESNGAGIYAYKEHPIEVLNPSITNDGGHLNAQGQQYLAANMLKVLASVPLNVKK